MGSSPTRGSSFFLGKVTALVCCVALPCLFVCPSFFLSSFSSLIINMYMYMYTIYIHVHVCGTIYLQADLNRGGVLWGGLQQLAGVHEAAESQLLQELSQVCRRGDHCVFDLHAC